MLGLCGGVASPRTDGLRWRFATTCTGGPAVCTRLQRQSIPVQSQSHRARYARLVVFTASPARLPSDREARAPAPGKPSFEAAGEARRCDANTHRTPTSSLVASQAFSGRMRCRIREIGRIDNFAVNAGRMLAVPCATAGARSKLPLASMTAPARYPSRIQPLL